MGEYHMLYWWLIQITMCHLAPDNRDLVPHTVLCYKLERMCVFLGKGCVTMCYQWPAKLHIPHGVYASILIACCITKGNIESAFTSLNCVFLPTNLDSTMVLYSTVVKALERDMFNTGCSIWGLISCSDGKKRKHVSDSTYDIKNQMDKLISIQSSFSCAKKRIFWSFGQLAMG